MGLLDDAIREHLELKRRHGADPEEVSRQEREALGAPARGEFAKPDEAEPEDGPASEEPEDVAGEPEPRGQEPEPEDEPEAAAESEPGGKEDPWLVEELANEEREAESPQEGEDVLEATPEFLQETPEHDRLWFEQKPPRDFDWDK